MMGGEYVPQAENDDADGLMDDAARHLEELLALPMGFSELALLAAARAQPRRRSDYDRHRLPSAN
jgi:hypothetical protein